MDGANRVCQDPRPHPDPRGPAPGRSDETGARENIRVGTQYLASWLYGKGAVPRYNLIEDSAAARSAARSSDSLAAVLRSAERRHPARRHALRPAIRSKLGAIGDAPHLDEAARLFHAMVTADQPAKFLTTIALSVASVSDWAIGVLPGRDG